MALVERGGALGRRGRAGGAAAALVTSIISRYGRRIGNEAMQALNDAAMQAVENGPRTVTLYLERWAQEFRTQLGQEAMSIANNVGNAITGAARQGHEAFRTMTGQDHDIVELIDENAPDPTQGMEIDNGPPAIEAARAASAPGGGNSGVSKETPISTYPSLSYGIQETHTTILPWTGWCSMVLPDTAAPLQLKIRMNSPYKMLDVTTGNTGATIAKYIYNKAIKEDGSFAPVDFPDAITGNGAAVNQRPAWRAYWAQQYSYYTVLGCEYKITIINPDIQLGGDVIIAKQMDSYSGAETATGNIMPLTYLTDALAYKNITWYNVENNNSNSGKNVQIISGTYKPGSIKRNIVNDGDVKTWTSTGSRNVAGGSSDDGAPPTLSEILTINAWRSPMAYAAPKGVNVQIELKYIVQYKDLRQQARYPARIGGDAGIQVNLGTSQTQIGNPYQQFA